MMRSLNFHILMRAAFFDINMSHSQVLKMPVEQSLRFMAVIGLDGMNSERKFIANVVDEINGTLLVVPGVYPQRPWSGGVIDASILIAFQALSRLIRKKRNLTSTWILWPGTCFS